MIRRASLLVTIFILAISSEAKAGLTSVELSVANNYEQSGAGLTSIEGYFATVNAFMQSASDFNGGIVTYTGPGSPGPYIPMTLVPLASNPLQLVPIAADFPRGFATPATLNAVLPFGTYTVTATNSVTLATQSATIGYTQNYLPNVAPQLTPANYAGLQGLNAGSAFDLQFNSFVPNANATFSDTEMFIVGPAGASVFSRVLSPSSTTVVLPAGTLAAGTTYSFQTFFQEGSSVQEPVGGAVPGLPVINYFQLATFVTFTTANGATPPQALISFSGGPQGNPVPLPPGPVGSLSSPIGGDGASDFYDFYWGGIGTFDAIASIAGADPNGSYEYELNPNGPLNVDLILDAADNFTATINEALPEGLYEIGIVADSPFDPDFTIDFATPVEGVSPSSVPEPSTVPLLASGLVTLFFLVRRQRRT